jgi:hypothetical protein
MAEGKTTEEEKRNGRIKFGEFLQACCDEAIRTVTEAYTVLDPQDEDAYRRFFKSSYMKAEWKGALEIIETGEVPAERVRNKLEDLTNEGLPAQMVLPPGFNKEIVLQKFSLGLVMVLLRLVLENGSSAQSELTPLQAQIHLVSQVWKHVKARSKDDRKITPEEEKRLHEALDSSIVDSDSLLAFLKEPERISTFLKDSKGVTGKPSTGQYL